MQTEWGCHYCYAIPREAVANVFEYTEIIKNWQGSHFQTNHISLCH